MNTAGVAQLKARLSSYLKRVKAGQEVLITERGVPVAKLTPLDGEEWRKTRRERLARAGLIRLGRGRLPRSFFSTPLPARPDGPSLLDCLLAEREENR